jgi:hypothetical protein
MDHKAQLQLAKNYENRKTSEKLALAQKLGTTKGFYLFYFDHLSKFQTQIECFEHVNELYYKIFKQHKYSSYNSFRRYLKQHLFNKK